MARVPNPSPSDGLFQTANVIAQIDLSAYVSRMAMARLFQSPKAASILQPVLARNAAHSIPDWGWLASVLVDESDGAIRLSLTEKAPLGDRLMEILRSPSGPAEKVDEQAKAAESVRSYLTAVVLLREHQGSSTGLIARLHLERFSPPRFVLGIAVTQHLVQGSRWWSDRLKEDPAIPTGAKELAKTLEEKNSHCLPRNASS